MPSPHGKSFATEAATVVKKWALEELRLDSLYSYIDRKNKRLQEVAKRLGATNTEMRAPHEPEADVWVHSLKSQ